MSPLQIVGLDGIRFAVEMAHLRLRAAWPHAAYGVLALLYCWPLFELPNGLGVTDWDQHFFYYGAVLKNAFEYGQWPFWNPWYCGGNVLWQNPQVALLSPAYPLSALMSLPLAMKVNIVLHFWVGLAGMHLALTRVIGLSFLPLVLYLASLFTFAGSMALHLNAGHSVFLPAMYLPLVMYAFLRSLTSGRFAHVVGAALVLALCLYNGGLHILPMAVVVLGGIGLAATVARRQVRPLLLAAGIVVAALGFAAPKLVPSMRFVNSPQFTDTRTGLTMVDRMDLPMMLRSYLDPFQARSLRANFEFQRHQWTEYGNYVGTLAILLTAASAVVILLRFRDRRHWLGLALALTTILLVLLTAGEFAWYAPATLSKHLPLFSSFRVPSRYGIVFPLAAAMTIAWAMKATALEGGLTGPARQLLALLFLLASMQLLFDNRRQFVGVFQYPPLEQGFTWYNGPTTIERDDADNPYAPNSPMFRALMAGKTFYHCYESLQLVHTADDRDPLIMALDGGARLSGVTFSPNRVSVAVVNGPAPTRILMNQNFAEGWTSTAGSVTPSPPEGKPSVLLPAGYVGEVSFSFVPPGLWLGLGILAATAAACAAAVVRERRLRPPAGQAS